jgi:hypothetical protein
MLTSITPSIVPSIVRSIGGGPSTKSVILTTTKSGTFTITLKGSGTVTFSWGDGSAKEDFVLSGSDTPCSHVYPDTAEKTVKITGDLLGVTFFGCLNMSMTGDISELKLFTNVQYLECWNNPGWHGDISFMRKLESLWFIGFQGSSFITGDISVIKNFALSAAYFLSTDIYGDVSDAPSVVNTLYLSNTNIGCSSTVPVWFGENIHLENNEWTSTEVDNFLIQAQVAGVTDCTINIAGTNAERTAASNAALTWLIDPADGNNTITVNE